MAPLPRPAPGRPAGGHVAPPLDPRPLRRLLQRRPARAAAVLAAMRPAQRLAQLHALALLPGEAPGAAAWVEPFAPLDHPDDLPAPLEPEVLACAEPDEARWLLAALSPAQRLRQAIAHAAWLAAFGYHVTHDELLAAWQADDARTTT